MIRGSTCACKRRVSADRDRVRLVQNCEHRRTKHEMRLLVGHLHPYAAERESNRDLCGGLSPHTRLGWGGGSDLHRDERFMSGGWK